MKHVLSWLVIQAVGVAAVFGLWMGGLAQLPFQSNPVMTSAIAAFLGVGLIAALFQDWKDVKWVATHVVRVGLLGTVIGLLIAFSSAKSGSSGDPNQIRAMIGTVVEGMYIALFATLFGVASNIWLKINMRLLGGLYED